MSRAVVVVGAGIAGLAAATHLAASCDVTVFEREAVAGGKIRSERFDGYVFDSGPNGFLSNAGELRELVRDAGLDDELVEAPASAARRFIYWGGTLHELPAKPPRALGMTLLSPLGKLRALGDVFGRVPRDADRSSESVAAFATRHFGREVAERIVAPAVLGVSGGRAENTSVDALFPRLREIERESGSLLRGMARSRRPRGHMTGFRHAGMQRLTDRLSERLGARVRLSRGVDRIEPHDSRWRVSAGGDIVEADAVLVTSPSDAAANLVEGFDGELARALRAIAYAPMRVAGIAFRASDAPPLDGFGFLAARGQGVRILGAVYTSTMFPDQAPEGVAYLRVFLGGADDPGAVELSSDAARQLVRADLATVLGITAAPIAYHEMRWPRAIPQYDLAHRQRVRTIEDRVRAHPGLALTGNAYRGLGVGDAVKDAVSAATRLT